VGNFHSGNIADGNNNSSIADLGLSNGGSDGSDTADNLDYSVFYHR
jgi:hypothetical protein